VNVVCYLSVVSFIVAVQLRPDLSEPFDLALNAFLAVLYVVLGLGCMWYGSRLYRVLIVSPFRSPGRTAKLREVTVIAACIAFAAFIRVTLTLTLTLTPSLTLTHTLTLTPGGIVGAGHCRTFCRLFGMLSLYPFPNPNPNHSLTLYPNPNPGGIYSAVVHSKRSISSLGGHVGPSKASCSSLSPNPNPHQSQLSLTLTLTL
jgi:hypothetical protein